MLLFMGRLVFINGILVAMVIYYFLCFFFPNSICYKLDFIFSVFFWSGSEKKKGIYWKRKQIVNLLKGFGGFDIR